MASDAMDQAATIFAGDGEMSVRGRALDWTATPLGPVSGWPEALRTIVRTAMESPFPMNLWCGPARTLIYNDAYRRLLGAKHPGALGRPGAEVWGEIWGEIAPMFERISAGGAPAYAEDAPFVMRRAADGAGADAWFTFSLSAVRDDAGAIVAFLNVAAETTGRVLAEQAANEARAAAERAEARLRDVFEQAPAFLAVLRGPGHVFEFVNDAYYQLVGHREIVGKTVNEALPEVRDQGFVELLDGVLRTGTPFIGREAPVRLARSPGAPSEQRFLDFAYQPLVEADGARAGIVAHGSDVTEQVLARREVERLLAVAEAARAEAERANRAKAEFLATMSHELRTPLNAIGGYAELIELGVHGPVTAAQAQALARIQTSQRHLLGLINEVLNYTRVEAGVVQYELERVPVAEAIATCEALTAPQMRAKRIAFHADPEGCGASVAARADREKLQQIMLNLLSNATKFTDPGGSIAVRCTVDGQAVALHVTDTGHGIPAERLESVFEPFVQVDARLTRTQEGVGLGLAISRDLARGMGGELSVESEVGVGSTFTLTLPRAG
jgi:PAS domain S-box-containing protein